MARNKFSYIVYAIIGLAIVGVVSQIFTNPTALFKGILIMIGLSVVLFVIFYFIFIRKRSNLDHDEMKKYKQAVKQSQQKYKSSHVNQTINAGRKKQQVQLKKKHKRRVSHLRVIDGTGNKQNEKNEPHFK